VKAHREELMGKNIEKSISVYGQKTHKKCRKTCKETEEFLPCITIDVKKLVSIPGTKNG